MPYYLSPGIYFEELPTLTDPRYLSPDVTRRHVTTELAGGRKSRWPYDPTAAFVGYTEQASAVASAHSSLVGRPALVENWSQYAAMFGGMVQDAYLPDAVYGYFLNGGQRCYILSLGTSVTPATSMGRTFDDAGGLRELENFDDITLVCAPDIMLEYERGGIDLTTVQALQTAIINHCERMQTCFGILDTPPALAVRDVRDWRFDGSYDTSCAALYYPWLEVANQTSVSGAVRTIPPCGHIAGIYARNDLIRGVHKSPANEVVKGVLGLASYTNKSEEDVLDPLGVNVLRSAPGQGIRVWGARSLSSDPEWRYLRTRRLVIYLQQALRRGTQWVLFEPHHSAALWMRIEQEFSDFLHRLWRSGALYGKRPYEAFYVRCDKETNPPESLAAHLVVVEIGVALEPGADLYNFRVIYRS